MNISWNEFCDKVYGCFMGKCIAGTIGAPYEGYKGIMDVEYTPELFGQAQTQSETIPNDDLDLQVLWLEVIEKTGANFTSDDLAKAFYEKCAGRIRDVQKKLRAGTQTSPHRFL